MSYKQDIIDWAIAASIRAIKTFAQTAVAMIPVEVSINEVTWATVAGVAATAAVCSLLTSVAGIPEVAGGASAFSLSKGE